MTIATEQELKSLFKSGGLKAVAQKIQSNFEIFERATLDIAVTGVSGTGKSTLVNALWGIGDGEPGAAPTGERKTTLEPTMYQYPNKDTVKIWDPPGIGTPNFPAKEYLQRVMFERYDFFIILSATRFTENDVYLAKEIQQMEKKFYFVRSEIDQELESAKRRDKSQYNENKALEELRNASVESLKKEGIESPQVFLISGWKLDKFDFELLQEVLEGDLPALKRRAFLLSLPNITSSIIGKKKEVMMGEIWQAALLSAAVGAVAAAVPIPGLSIACDIPLLVRKLSSYRTDFGLDDDSLGRLAKSVRKTREELRSAVKSKFGVEVSANVIRNELPKISKRKRVLIRVAKCLQLLGSAITAGTCFSTTYNLLEMAVEELAEDSKRVLAKVFKVTD